MSRVDERIRSAFVGYGLVVNGPFVAGGAGEEKDPQELFDKGFATLLASLEEGERREARLLAVSTVASVLVASLLMLVLLELGAGHAVEVIACACSIAASVQIVVKVSLDLGKIRGAVKQARDAGALGKNSVDALQRIAAGETSEETATAGDRTVESPRLVHEEAPLKESGPAHQATTLDNADDQVEGAAGEDSKTGQ